VHDQFDLGILVGVVGHNFHPRQQVSEACEALQFLGCVLLHTFGDVVVTTFELDANF
jgi:hypothetical protein